MSNLSTPLHSPAAPIRYRVGMYIGGTDQRALHHLVYILLDNAAEEAFIGKCTAITLTLLPDNQISVADNADGLPVKLDEQSGLSRLELIMTEPLMPKDRFAPNRYSITGGLHGLGLFVVSALADSMIVEVARNGFVWRQRYRAGETASPLEKVRPLKVDESTGTVIIFRPDFTILQPNSFDFDVLAERCHELAYQISGLKMTIRDERSIAPREAVYFAEDGLCSLVRDLSQSAEPLNEPIHSQTEVQITRTDGSQFRFGLEFALQFSRGSETIERSYINTVQTSDGGTHRQALCSGLVRSVSGYFRATRGINLRWQDISPGLTAVISLRHPNPQFASPTKIKFSDPTIHQAISNTVYAVMNNFILENPAVMESIVTHCLSNWRSHRAQSH